MDDFSKAILQGAAPTREDCRPCQRARRDRSDDALDHLAAPILLERAAYLRKLARLERRLSERGAEGVSAARHSSAGSQPQRRRRAARTLRGSVLCSRRTRGSADGRHGRGCEDHRARRGSRFVGARAVCARNCAPATWHMCRPGCPTRCWSPATSSSPASWSRSSRIRREPEWSRRSGAGDRDRTGDIQLGKLTFYH